MTSQLRHLRGLLAVFFCGAVFGVVVTQIPAAKSAPTVPLDAITSAIPSAINFTALKSEINTDPRAMGYAAAKASDTSLGALAALLNAPSNNAADNGAAGSTGLLPTYKFFEALDATEWAAQTTAKQTLILQMLAVGSLDPTGPNTRANVQNVLASGVNMPTSIANLGAMVKRRLSRVEVLFGVGTTVSATDCANALSNF